ncbi:hypothetical protein CAUPRSCDRAFT_11786 [Caulochytrium protostelioides]|nr:hypothetical protein CAUPRSCDRAFT_11786 [Caulochytrium protostelioides]
MTKLDVSQFYHLAREQLLAVKQVVIPPTPDSLIHMAMSVAIISAVGGVLGLVSLWYWRHHPAVRFRVPYMVATEMALTPALVILLASMAQPWHTWDAAPCWGLLSCVTMLLWLHYACDFARLALFYRLAQLNCVEQGGRLMTLPFVDRIMDIIGVLVGSREYDRAAYRVTLVRQRNASDVMVASAMSLNLNFKNNIHESTPDLFDVSQSMTSMNTETDVSDLRQSTAPWSEVALWWLKLAAFGMLGFLTSMGFLTAQMGWSIQNMDIAAAFPFCYLHPIYIIFYLATFSACFLLLTVAMLLLPNDSFGFKVELILVRNTVQACVLAVSAMFDNFERIVPLLYLILSSLLVQLISIFFIPVSVIIWDAHEKKRTLSQITSISLKSEKDVAELWTTEAGRAMIARITRAAYAFEIYRFLMDTNSAKAAAPRQAKYIFQNYISREAPFELNLQSRQIKAWEQAVNRNNVSPELIQETRQAVFVDLFNNYKHKIVAELAQIQSDKARKDTHLAMA